MSFINRIRTLAFFLLLLSFYSTWAESKSQYPDGFSFVEYVNNFVVNIGPEVAGIAITVLLIDYLSEKRDDQQRVQRESELYLQKQELLKAQLIRELGNGERGIATKALEELRAQGWLYDKNLLVGGCLRNVNLNSTDLKGVCFKSCDLSESNFSWADLEGADLSETDLAYANLTFANLRNAKLDNANLIGVSINNANLRNASLRGARLDWDILDVDISLEGAIMPTGIAYEKWIQNRTN